MPKLTFEQVLEIRADERRPMRIIAEEYGIDQSYVGRLIRGDRGKDPRIWVRAGRKKPVSKVHFRHSRSDRFYIPIWADQHGGAP